MPPCTLVLGLGVCIGSHHLLEKVSTDNIKRKGGLHREREHVKRVVIKKRGVKGGHLSYLQ